MTAPWPGWAWVLPLAGGVDVFVGGLLATCAMRVAAAESAADYDGMAAAARARATATRLGRSLQASLDAARVQVPLTTVLATFAASWVLSLAVLLICDVPPLQALPFSACLPLLEWLLIARKARKAGNDFSRQLGDALPVVASGLRSGMSLATSLGSFAEKADEPIHTELTSVRRDVEAGISFADALRSMAERMKSKDADLLAVAVAVQAKTGAGLADTIERLAEAIRERERLRGKAEALTVQNKTSARFLTVMPFALTAWFCYSSDLYREFYFSWTGFLVLAGIGASITVGNLVINRICNIEVE